MSTAKSIVEVAADFDRIAAALAASRAADRLTPAERSLLKLVPVHATRAVDVGCGDGALTRAIAGRGVAVLGIDVSPGMIALARSRTGPDRHIEYRVADIMTYSLPARHFDVVLSVAMVHHLSLEVIVPRLAAAVAPGGVLLIQDVMTRRGVRQFPFNAVAALRRRLRQVVYGSRITRQARLLYDAHGVGEEYLAPSAVAPAYRDLLPGAQVHTHLEWRYTVIWRRSSEPNDD